MPLTGVVNWRCGGAAAPVLSNVNGGELGKLDKTLALRKRAFVLAAGITLAATLAAAPALAQDTAATAEENYRALSAEVPARAGDPAFDYALGIAALDTGRYGEAIIALQRVLALQPANAAARAELARAYALAGDIDTARAQFATVVDDPSLPDPVRQRFTGFVRQFDKQMAGSGSDISGFVDARFGHDSNINSATELNSIVIPLFSFLGPGQLGETASGGFDTAAVHELYIRFFPPEIERALKHKTSLVFPSGGILAQIPPAVLMSRLPARTRPGRYLIEDYAITIRSSLRPLARAGRALASGFAGIGAPQLAPPRAARASLRGVTINPKDLRALPSLPGSQAELEAMREAFVGEEALLLTGADATEPKVRAAGLGAYRVLAFSTHGLVGGQMAALPEPALVLTPPEIPSPDDDGLLTASEIAGLELAADWVILSACNTAAGDGRGSATYSGLARAFQLAGARSLLLSHWPVRDDAAAFLAVETLRRAEAGTDRAQALQAAQLALVRGTTGLRLETSPGVWAPFVLIDYRHGGFLRDLRHGLEPIGRFMAPFCKTLLTAIGMMHF